MSQRIKKLVEITFFTEVDVHPRVLDDEHVQMWGDKDTALGQVVHLSIRDMELSQMDGWADLPDDYARVRVVDMDVEVSDDS